MKRTAITIVISSLFLVSSFSFVAAQEATTTGTTRPQVVATKTTERAEERKEIKEERQASRAAALDEKNQAIVTRIVAAGNRMVNRANKLIERLDNIWTRVESRMQKIEASGKDLSSLNSLVTQVVNKRAAAITAVSSASASLGALEGSSEPKTAAMAVRDSFKNVRMAIGEYHKSIVDVIRNLKGFNTEVKISGQPTATSGATVTGTTNQ